MLKPYKSTVIRRYGIALLFLTAAFGLVHALPSFILPLKAEKTANEKAKMSQNDIEILRDAAILPPQVERMRRAILAAASSGEIDAMRVPVEMNEIPPMIADKKVPDPVAHWKTISGDGEGREILAILVQLFRTGFVRKDGGTADEMFIWPYFAETPIDKLTPAQEVELLTIVSPARAKAMKASGKYDHYRIGIAHDGTWHFFLDQPH
jgi:hypothetical protein